MELFSKKDPESQGLTQIEQGVKSFQKGVSKEEESLRDLFAALKTDILDELMGASSARTKRQHIRVLDEQVRHVISVARAIGDRPLIHSFEQEEEMLTTLKDLFEQFPDANMTSPDIREALDKLRGLMADQQDMIFNHSRILSEEKQRLIAILQQVEGLKQDRKKDAEVDRSLSAQERPVEYM